MNNYPLASTTWNEEELQALRDVIDSGNFTMGEIVKDFESQFAKYIGSNYAVMFNSGSSANLGLVAACKYMEKPIFGDGDEIIVPAVSWSTTYYPVSQMGAVLRFVDIDLDTLNIDFKAIERLINSRTKAIFVVNLLGNPANLTEIISLAEKYNLTVIEDNCESLGAILDGKKLGTFGLGGTYSFFFSHHMSTMEGGMVSTDNEELYQILKSVRAHGWTRDLPFENFVHSKTGTEWEDQFRFVLPGYNMRPLEMEAATGRVQLRKLDSFVQARRNNAKYFIEAMAPLKSYRIQKEVGESSWFGFSLVLKGELIGKRSDLVKVLKSHSIESRPIVAGNFTKNPVLKHLNHAPIANMQNADLVHSDGLFVGNHHFDLSREIEYLVEILSEFEREYES